MTDKRLVLACGGTGGHFYPAYALARALMSRNWRPLFILRKDDPAAKVLADEDLPFVELDLGGMPRSLLANWPRFGVRVIRSWWLARNVLKSFTPQCVVGMGGYITFPMVTAAGWLRIPAMLHESNAKLGLANRLCLPFAPKVAMGLPIADPPRWPRKAIFTLTGTPVREEFYSLPRADDARRSLGLDPEKSTLLVFGGSQGARGINRLIPDSLRLIAARKPDGLQCLHLSGANDEASVRAAYEGVRMRILVKAYLREMHQAYAASDLVVSRSGASTVAELCIVRRPAILIPLPSAAAGHQEDNASVLTKAGAATMLRQAKTTPESLAKTIEDLIFSSEQPLRRMASGYETLKLPRGAETIASLVAMVESLG